MDRWANNVMQYTSVISGNGGGRVMQGGLSLAGSQPLLQYSAVFDTAHVQSEFISICVVVPWHAERPPISLLLEFLNVNSCGKSGDI